MENKLPRQNIRLSEKVMGYFDNKSKLTGVARSSLMLLALEEYIDQKEGLNSMAELQIMYQKAIEIESKKDNN